MEGSRLRNAPASLPPGQECLLHWIGDIGLRLSYLKLPRPITYDMAVSSEISIIDSTRNNHPGFEVTNCSRVALLSVVTSKWTYVTTIYGNILSTCLPILQSIYQARKKHEFITTGLQFDPCTIIIVGVTILTSYGQYCRTGMSKFQHAWFLKSMRIHLPDLQSVM
jgi:hypothetical protein